MVAMECVMRGTPAMDMARNPSITNNPAMIDARPTCIEPRKFIQVAPQITASDTIHSECAFNPGTK